MNYYWVTGSFHLGLNISSPKHHFCVTSWFWTKSWIQETLDWITYMRRDCFTLWLHTFPLYINMWHYLECVPSPDLRNSVAMTEILCQADSSLSRLLSRNTDPLPGWTLNRRSMSVRRSMEYLWGWGRVKWGRWEGWTALTYVSVLSQREAPHQWEELIPPGLRQRPSSKENVI